MDWLQFVINGGALVIVAAVIYYVFTKSTPDLIATFTGELRTQREAHNTELRLARESFLGALQQQRSDFREELATKRESVIEAIWDERQKPGIEFLTFNRVRDIVAQTAGRDSDSAKNVVNSMVDLGVLKADAERFGRDPDSGQSYSFHTFSLDLQHPDVRTALKLGA